MGSGNILGALIIGLTCSMFFELGDCFWEWLRLLHTKEGASTSNRFAQSQEYTPWDFLP